MMSFNQLRKLAFAAVAVVGLAAPASAYTIDTIPSNSNILDPGTQGYFGANLYLFGGPANITYSLYHPPGSEAGAQNSFSFLTTAGEINNFGANGNVVVNQASGFLDFLFTTNLAVVPNTVVNGSNVPRGSNIPNFFVSFFAADGVTLGAFGSGTSGVIALDDSDGSPADADYDDLVIKFSLSGGGVAPVPEASTWAMMLLGFAGIGFLAYRRKPKAAFRFA
jgi:hypothetical protein